MAETTTPAPRRRRGLKIALGIVVVAIVLLVGVVAALFLVNPEFIGRQVTERVLPKVSQRIGRQVTLGSLDVKLFPPSATLTQLQIAGAPGEPPFVQAGAADAGIELWPLIKSRGKDVRVDSITLRDVDVHLVRRADGTWSHDDIVKNLHATAPPEQQQQPSNANVVVSQITLENGRLHLVDGAEHGPDGDAILLDQLGVTLRNVGPGLPLTAELSGALAANSPNLKAKLTVDPLPMDPAALTPDQYPNVSGNVSITNAQLERFSALLPAQTDALISGGLLGLQANVGTDSEKRYGLTGTVNLKDLRLRGQPASGSFALKTRYDLRHPQAMAVTLDDIKLKGPGVDLAGNAQLAHNPDRVQFALQGPLLDMDALLGVLPKSPQPAQTGPKPLVPATVRRQLGTLRLDGTLALGQVRSGKLQAQNLKAHATMEKGVLTLAQGEAEAYAGKLALDGTSIDLRKPKPAWNLKARVESMNLGQAFTALSNDQPMQGLLSGTLDLKGEGNLWSELVKTVTGGGLLKIAQGELTTASLQGAMVQKFGEALQLVGQGAVAKNLAQERSTTIRDLTGQFAISDGWIKFKNPISFQTSLGGATLDGRVGLDRQLDLTGTVDVAPQFVANLTGNQLKPSKPVQVPLKLDGTLKAPQFVGIDSKVVAQQLVQASPVGQAVEKEKQSLQNEARRRMKGFLRVP